MAKHPALNRIPGESVASKNHLSEGYIKDLGSLEKCQLLDLRDRNLKILSNKYLLRKLPDQGNKIKNFYENILKQIALKEEVEQAAELFSQLNIASKGHKAINNLEWNGKIDMNPVEEVLDSDDEEEIDELKILAESRDIEKRVKIIKEEKKLITELDLDEIESFKNEKLSLNIENNKKSPNTSNSSDNSSNDQLELEQHAKYLCDKSIDGNTKVKFRPNFTTTNNSHDPDKEKLRKHGKHWEITAATPPPLRCHAVEMLSLKESIEIENKYRVHLKETIEKQAEERLAQREKRFIDRITDGIPVNMPNQFKTYRELEEKFSSDEEKFDSDDEVVDDPEEPGGVVYTIKD